MTRALTPPIAQAPEDYQLRYTALAREHYKAKNGKIKTRYYKFEAPIEEADFPEYLKGGFRGKLDLELSAILKNERIINRDDLLDSNTLGEKSSYPGAKFSLAEALSSQSIEDIDLAASTPYRNFVTFSPNYSPNTLESWLFIGYTIGVAILSVGYIFRQWWKTPQPKDNDKKLGIELLNSNIGWARNTPTVPPSRFAKALSWIQAGFELVFTYAMWYWVLWSFVSMAPAVIALSPLIVFLVPLAPLVFVIILKLQGPVRHYLRGNKAQISEQDRLDVLLMEKINQVEQLASSDFHIEAKSLHEHLSSLEKSLSDHASEVTLRPESNLGAESSEDDEERTDLLASSAQTKISASLAQKKLIENPYDRENLQKGAQKERPRLKLGASFIMGFLKGFAMTTLIFFAFSSLMGASMGVILLPAILSTLIGVIYAVHSYRTTKTQLSEHGKNYKRPDLKVLIDKINSFYQLLLIKRQKVADLETALNASGISTQASKSTAFAAAVDNPDFISEGRIIPRSQWGRFKKSGVELWVKFLIFIGGAESGSLLFRVIFGVVATIGGISLVGNPPLFIGIAIAIAAVGLGFGITALCRKWSENAVAKEKLFLDQVSLLIVSLSTENQVLDKALERLSHEQRLGVSTHRIDETTPAANHHPEEGVFATGLATVVIVAATEALEDATINPLRAPAPAVATAAAVPWINKNKPKIQGDTGATEAEDDAEDEEGEGEGEGGPKRKV